MSILHSKTQELLESLAFEAEGVIGIHAIDPLEPDDEFAVNADELFPTASTIKIPILLEFYNQVADGTINKDEEHILRETYKVGGTGVLQHLTDKTRVILEDWAKLMIILSDNTATNYLIDLVSMKYVNNLLEGLGIEKTRLLRKMQATQIDPNEVENLSTPRELSTLLMMIMNHDGLDENVCENTLTILKISKDGIICDALPKDHVVADKSGWMGGVECDSGIIYAEKPYIVTIMAKNIPEWDRNALETKEIMKQAVAAIHDYFTNKATASKYGRRIR